MLLMKTIKNEVSYEDCCSESSVLYRCHIEKSFRDPKGSGRELKKKATKAYRFRDLIRFSATY